MQGELSVHQEKQKGQPLTFEFVVGDKDLNYNDNNMLPNKSLEPIGNKTCLWLNFPLSKEMEA